MSLILFIISACFAFFTGVIISDVNDFCVTKYRIKSKKIKKHIRFVQLTDLHGKEFGSDNKRLVAAVDRLKPDFVIMSGDIMSGKNLGRTSESTVDTAESLIRKLALKYPVYFAPGNHEQRVEWLPDLFSFTYRDMMERFDKAGATILDNAEYIRIGDGICIKGLALHKDYYLKKREGRLAAAYLDSAVGKLNEKYFNILIAHTPEYIPDYAKWGADLTLSGHYHGGIMKMPFMGGVISPKYRLFPKYSFGMFSEGGKKQIVSCGLGTHTLPVRVFNPGELVCVDLMPDRKD